MIRTKFQAVTDRRDMKGRPFIRTSQSHNAAKPFTHVVLTQRQFDDERGTCWFADSWASSAVLAEKAAEPFRKRMAYCEASPFRAVRDSDLRAVEVVPVVIVGTVGKDHVRCADCGKLDELTGHMGCQYPQEH